MTRLIAAVALSLAALGTFGGTASATPLGTCGGKVDAACGWSRCHPEEGCTIRFCLVWAGSQCHAQAQP